MGFIGAMMVNLPQNQGISKFERKKLASTGVVRRWDGVE